MTVQTIKATIQMRCGMEADLQPDKLVTGEWAVAKDTRKVWMCFRPGLVLRMATYEAFEQDMLEVQTILATCQDIQAAVERFMQLAQQHASQAEEWSVTSKSWAVGGTGTRQGENTNNSQYWSQQSQNHSNMSKSWAIGEGNLRPDEAVNSAKYFADQAGKIVDAAGSGGLIPMGTVTFENLPTSGMKKGWMYNISNDFTSDSRFEDGGGIKYNAGSNVYYTAVGKWDVLAGRQVSGVKGSVETSYRTGDVNITKANIGLENVPNVTTNNQTPTFTQASTRVNIASGEKLSVIFGKLMKWYADLETVAFSGSYTDLSNKPTIPTNMTGATASAAGKAGLAPAPGAGKQNAYLRGDGTWVAPATTLTGTVAGIPLDQTMGKKLDDKISVINSNLSVMNTVTLLTANWNTSVVTESRYCKLYKIGKIGLFSLAFECKALKPWTNYKLCDITSAGFSFAHDTAGLVNDQNDDSAVTIECTLEHPQSIYLRTFEKTHSVTWYRGFILVLCTN